MTPAEELSWDSWRFAMLTAPPRYRPSNTRYVVDGADVSSTELRELLARNDVVPVGDWVSGGPNPVSYFARR